MQQKFRAVLPILFAVVLLGGSFATGFFVGKENGNSIPSATLSGTADGKPTTVDFSLFWKVWGILDEKYVHSETVTEQQRVYGAIQGLAASLGDPYTEFFPPEEKKVFDETLSGNFGGVGMEIGMRDNAITVIAPLKGTPADRAGVRSGDKVLTINGTSTAELSLEGAVSLIRGEIGTKVKLTMLHVGADAPYTIELTRETIVVPSIDTVKRKDGIFVIGVHNFTASAPSEFRDALRTFVQTGGDKLILDLRGDPGGYLDAAVDMTSWFLPVGKVVVREREGKGKSEAFYRSRGYNIFNSNLKMVILVDGGSASASEIMAGALQEHGIATLVGTKTFGKGSVQELVPVNSDTSLKVTIAQWFTPNGISISKAGLKPDVEVPYTIDDAKAGKDPQMDKAVGILLGK